MHRRAAATLPGGVSSNFRLGGVPVPLSWASGSGAHLIDVDGNEYVDYVLGMGPAILGHAHPALVHAVEDALKLGQTLAGQTTLEVELAEMIVSLVPSAEQVRLASSGSEAVQLALRLARAATGRPLVLKFEGHYHGWFDSILVSTNPPISRIGSVHSPTPYIQSAGQSIVAASETRVLPWNDAQAVEGFLQLHGHETAAVIMEPILCNTSVVMPRDGYLEQVRRLCHEYGVVLIFDEVITGFRLGPGGAQGLLGVLPDLTTLGKALGGGFPIAAVTGPRSLMELTVGSPPAIHGGTYNANLPATSAALACLRMLSQQESNPYQSLFAMGERLMEGLREIGGSTQPRLQVQGTGPVFNTYFTDGGAVTDFRSYQSTDLERQRRFLHQLQNRGVRVTSRGTWFLSTVHSDADINATLEAAAEAIADLEPRGDDDS
jgi:glutamate-1-semialdehyde 2,1-aminomutase